MTKKEIQQILDQGWEARRQKLKERSAKNSQAVKEWKAREATGLPPLGKRQKHYLKDRPGLPSSVRELFDQIKKEKDQLFKSDKK